MAKGTQNVTQNTQNTLRHEEQFVHTHAHTQNGTSYYIMVLFLNSLIDNDGDGRLLISQHLEILSTVMLRVYVEKHKPPLPPNPTTNNNNNRPRQ